MCTERIIFVDADQVVRGDLLDLWNLDLQGKPYGVYARWYFRVMMQCVDTTEYIQHTLRSERVIWKRRDFVFGKPDIGAIIYGVNRIIFRLCT